jgi:hypothetical protein
MVSQSDIGGMPVEVSVDKKSQPRSLTGSVQQMSRLHQLTPNFRVAQFRCRVQNRPELRRFSAKRQVRFCGNLSRAAKFGRFKAETGDSRYIRRYCHNWDKSK